MRPSGRGVSGFAPATSVEDRLQDVGALRDNPGNLHGRFYVPEGLDGPVPLVVVLHGCTQNAAVYDHGSGWSRLADRHGFALLFPEQKRANNSMLCFNWFSGDDNRRGRGEAASIANQIAAMGRAHPVDPNRVFVTGLSAGGAMATVMLATYPELFAAGAIVAGLAYGSASDVSEAFDRMNTSPRADGDELALKVRRASPHQGPWPRIQVWHGSADRIVAPGNADAIVRQWTSLHRLDSEPSRIDSVAGYPRRLWSGPDGVPLVEEYTITGMAHGVPLDPGQSEGESGQAGAHMLDVGLSSTDRIAAFFGIAPAPVETSAPRERSRRAPTPDAATGVQATIENALRAAGLMS